MKRYYLLVVTGSGKQEVNEARADEFLIKLAGLLRHAGIQLQMGTECLCVYVIQ